TLKIPLLLDDLVDRHKGQRAFVVGNGPSLKQLDMPILKDEITIGSNRVYLGFEDWGFNFTYWAIADSLQFEKYTREWEQNIPAETMKFYPFEYLGLFNVENGIPINFFPPGHPENKTNFIDPFKTAEQAAPNGFSNTPDSVYLGHTVTYAMLQLAVIMGCDPIYMIGSDHRYAITKNDKKRGLWKNENSENHFHKDYGKYSKKTNEFHLPEAEKSERAFNYANEWAQQNGVEILNATPGTALPSFPLIDFDDALQKGVRGTVVPSLVSPKKQKTTQAPKSVISSGSRSNLPPTRLRRLPRSLRTARRKSTRTATILVCTPDLSSELATKCIRSIKEHTHIPYELLVFENGKFGRFQHPLEINRAIEIALGDVVVTFDDDVELTDGWLESLMKLATPDVGLVGNVHLNSRDAAKGTIRHTGGWIALDGSPMHHTEAITEAIAVPYVCSACMLINDRSLRFNLDYKKYFQEAELCLDSWRKGKKVMVSPHRIYHYGSGQMEQLGNSKADIQEASRIDQELFARRWINSGVMRELYEEIDEQLDIRVLG
ncbi:MAG: glycosyltransferase, partial [Candidatus Hydrogenedentota bacterium]